MHAVMGEYARKLRKFTNDKIGDYEEYFVYHYHN
jgi:hypothetical protein